MRKYIFQIVGVYFLFTSLSFSQITKQKFLDDDFEKQEWFLKNQNEQAFIKGDSNFTLLGRWAWGPCRAMAITGKYALVGQGWMYQVYDLSDPFKPAIVYDTIMEGPVVDIKIKDTLLFVLLAGTAIIYDSRSLYPLVEYGRYNTGGGVALRDMAVSDSILYLMGKYSGVIAVNIENLSQPYFRWYFTFGYDNPSAIASTGKYVFYGALGPMWDALYILEHVPDTNFVKRKEIWIEGNAVAIHLSDTLLFVGNNAGRLFIFNICDPWNPQTIDSIDLNSCIYEITSRGENLYCSTLDSGIVVINISEIANPIIKTRINQYFARKFSNSNDILGVVRYGSFSFFNIQIVDSITQYVEMPVCVNTFDIVLKGNVGFIAAGDNGIWSVDFSNPAHPSPIMNLPISGFTFDIDIAGNLICVLTSKSQYGIHDSLTIVQYDDSGKIERKSAIEVSDNTTSLSILDSIVVIGADSVVGIYSIADPLYPKQISSWDASGGRYNRVSIAGNCLAVATLMINEGLHLLDISNISNPSETFCLPISAVGVLLKDTLAFVASGDFLIYKTPIQSFPIEIGRVFSPSYGDHAHIYISDNYAYNVGQSVRVINIDNLAQPIQVDSLFSVSTSPEGMAINNNQIYVTTKYEGIWILKNNLIDSNKDELIELPVSFSLKNNYPNPFNPSTIIEYQLSTKSHVTIKVFDLLGREISILIDDIRQAGIHKVKWNASGVPAGVYFYRITTDNYSKTNKMLLIR
jgi:hypothetical protein